VRDWQEITGAQSGINAKATYFGVTSEKTAYNNAVSALSSYLGGLSPAWNHTGSTTTISRTVWNANWADVFNKRQALLNEIAHRAGQQSEWAQVHGSGKPEDGATVGATLEERAQFRTTRHTFMEDFSSVEYREYWVKISGSGAMSYYSGGSSKVGGGAARLNDYVVMHHRDKVPFDPDKLYRIEARVYFYNHEDTTRTLYAGLAGFDANGNYCNVTGADTYSSQHYVLAANLNLVGQYWQRLVAYVKGNASGNAVYSTAREGNHIGNPAKLQANVRFITPLFFGNYSNKTGDMLIDYVKIDVVEVQDQRNLPLIQSAIASLPTSSALSAADVGSTARITVAAHTLQFGFGTISYNSGSISGLSFSRKYYVYCDDPELNGGTVTYQATTSFTRLAANTWRRSVGTIRTPANGGGGTIPDDPWCVAADTWLTEKLQADHCKAGDLIDCWDLGDRDTHPGAIQAVKPQQEVPCVLLTMASGAQVICSRETPVTDSQGTVYEAQHCQGVKLGVLHEEEPLTWETVEQVECAGLRTVYKISVGNISYAAGVDSQHRVITHNQRHKP
ncbi:hypothetical protein ACL7TT_06715, partial [Microbulbifer sp. 2304DJ12-6]